MDNGTEVIARIPCPIAGPAHLTVASEVATLEFARTHLKIPVPKVLAWSSCTSEKEVGAEYIIMEKLSGVPLYDRWLEFEPKDAKSFIVQMVDYESRFPKIRFSQIGSLYFKEDVEPALQALRLYADGVPDDEASERFRIGPTLQREFWRGERIELDIDRGPWPDPVSYALAIINCEKLWLRTHARPRAPADASFTTPEEQNISTHLEMLDRFASVLPYIINDTDFFSPTLWHSDLHGSNIIVRSTGSPELVGIVDWTEWIGPRFLRAVFAPLFIYDGYLINPHDGLPHLPDAFDNLTPNEQQEARDDLRLAARHIFYKICMRKNNLPHHEILQHPHLNTFSRPFQGAARSWTDSLYPLRQGLIQVKENWDTLAPPGVQCPLEFAKDELEGHHEQFVAVGTHEARTQSVYSVLKLEPDGVVEPERYDAMMVNVKLTRGLWNDKECGGPFPLQDGAWSSLL